MAEHDTMRDQEVAEDLDADKLSGEYPPEEPMGAEDYGVTAREEAVEEPIDERVEREEPDQAAETAVAEGEGRPVGAVIEPDEGAGPDEEKDAVAHEVRSDEDERLDAGDIASGDDTLRDTATERAGDRPAEESAMHETEQPPLGDPVPPDGTGDDYIDPDEK